MAPGSGWAAAYEKLARAAALMITNERRVAGAYDGARPGGKVYELDLQHTRSALRASEPLGLISAFRRAAVRSATADINMDGHRRFQSVRD